MCLLLRAAPQQHAFGKCDRDTGTTVAAVRSIGPIRVNPCLEVAWRWGGQCRISHAEVRAAFEEVPQFLQSLEMADGGILVVSGELRRCKRDFVANSSAMKRVMLSPSWKICKSCSSGVRFRVAGSCHDLELRQGSGVAILEPRNI